MNTTTIKVTLLKDGHTHAGKACAKGAVIDVTPSDAAWMADPARALIAPLPATKAAVAAKHEG